MAHYGSGISCQYVSMKLSVEDTFKNELYKKYESLKKVLIPKPEYAIRCATYITERQRFRIYSSNHFRFERVVARANYSAW